MSLALFIAFGVPRVDAASFFSNADGGFWRDGLSGFMAALSMMSFACMGTSTMLGVLAYMRSPILRVSDDGWLPAVFQKTTKGGYPWVLYLVLYAVSLIPLVTGLDIEGVIGNTMIPTMIINVIMNLYCLRLPKLFPEQWEKRGLRYPKGLWNLCSVAGSIFCVMIIYNLFINLNAKAAVLCIGELVVMFVIPFVTLKMKWVSPELLASRKQEITRRALADSNAED